MYFYTFNGIPQTMHASKVEALRVARVAMEKLKTKLNIQWVCSDTSDDATTLRKWNVLHGAEAGLFDVSHTEKHMIVLGFNMITEASN